MDVLRMQQHCGFRKERSPITERAACGGHNNFAAGHQQQVRRGGTWPMQCHVWQCKELFEIIRIAVREKSYWQRFFCDGPNQTYGMFEISERSSDVTNLSEVLLGFQIAKLTMPHVQADNRRG
jgi:hypothetical protein